MNGAYGSGVLTEGKVPGWILRLPAGQGRNRLRYGGKGGYSSAVVGVIIC